MRVRVDFGRILPGLLLLLVGLALLALLIVVAIVAFFFSFISTSTEVLRVAVELMLVPVVLIAAGIITMLTGTSWWGMGGEGWLSGVAKARARDDRLRFSSRVGELIGVGIGIIIFFFLYANQLRGVEFFTSEFGGTEQFLFYAPLFTGMALSLARAAYGRRNAIRPIDSLNALFLAVCAFWLLSVFPFDFTHFADMFPASIQFIFAWLNNDIGWLLFFIAGVCSIANMFYTALLYASVRGNMTRRVTWTV